MVLLLAILDTIFFQLGLVSQSDKHCKLYQGMIIKLTESILKLTFLKKITGLSTPEMVRDKGPKSR